jgi:hypothetical protein
MEKVRYFFNFCKKIDLFALGVTVDNKDSPKYVIKKVISESVQIDYIKKNKVQFEKTFGAAVNFQFNEINIQNENKKFLLYLTLEKDSLLSGLYRNVDCLLFFCKTIGIQKITVISNDSYLSTFNLLITKNANNFKRLYVFLLDVLIFAFGNAISIEIHSVRDILKLRLNEKNKTVSLNDITNIIPINNLKVTTDPEEFKINLVIKKDILLNDQGVYNDSCTIVHFLFEKRLIRLFKMPVSEIEELLFSNNKPTTIVVYDSDIGFTSSCLNIYGKNELEDISSKQFSIDPQTKNKIEIYRQTAHDRLNWNGFYLKQLTPMHFLLSRVSGTAGEIEKVIAAKFLHLFILYTANLSSYNKNKLTSSYISSDHTIKLTLALEKKFEVEMNTLEWLINWVFRNEPINSDDYNEINLENETNHEKNDINIFKRFFNWMFRKKNKKTKKNDLENIDMKAKQDTGEASEDTTYSIRITERLIMLQTVITRTFETQTGKPSENYRQFIIRLKELKSEVIWHYRVFIEGQIDKHFEQIQKIEYDLADVAKEVSKKIDSVTKGFIDTFLATIGVIVLTVVASLIKQETNGFLFRFGMWIYAAYLLIFHVIYRMASIKGSFSHLETITNLRLKNYDSKVSKHKMQTLLKPLKDQKKQFKFWFFLTVAIYFLVIFVLAALGQFLPRFLETLNPG